MNPTKEIADALYRDRVLQARRTPVTEKLFDGGNLFDDVCERMRAGIAAGFPPPASRKYKPSCSARSTGCGGWRKAASIGPWKAAMNTNQATLAMIEGGERRRYAAIDAPVAQRD